MPIVKIKEKLVYYCHIPKCAGTSISTYFIENGFEVSLLNTSWKRYKPKWSKTSPQHLTFSDIASIKMASVFDISFAVVRHPVDRFLSAFAYNKMNGLIPWWKPMNLFLKELEKNNDEWHYKFDNHFRPAVEFILPETKIFKIENGENEIIHFLDSMIGKKKHTSHLPYRNKGSIKKKSIRPRTISRQNIIKYTIKNKTQLNSKELKYITSFYRKDLEELNYDY